jgi:TonB family protein
MEITPPVATGADAQDEAMKRHLRFLAWTIFLVIGPNMAQAAALRAPTGKWVVDFADHQCLASRNYGTTGDPLYLALKPSPQGKMMQIAVVRKGRKGSWATEAPVTIQIDGGAPLQLDLLAFGAKADPLRTLLINLPSASFAPMRRATKLSIEAPGEIDESFALTQMPSLMVEVDRCLADLERVWNVGHAAKAGLRTRATANLAKYFSSSDYPDTAVRSGEGGTVEFALLIDETGKVADCMVTATSHVPVLDAQSCAVVIERARFVPAVGADGKPAKDAVINRVRWVMP